MIQVDVEKTSGQAPTRRAEGEWCDGCGATEKLARFPDRHETLCPHCANLRVTGEQAVKHLAWQLAKLLPDWREHWIARGAEPGWLDEVLEEVADALWLGLEPGEREALGFPKSRRTN